MKMRLGWDDDNLTAPYFAREFEKVGVAAVTIHGRTREQGFGGGVNHDGIRRVVEAVERIPVFGNGDVRSIADAARMIADTGCHGIAIGRGALADPWVFRQFDSWVQTGDPGPRGTYAERLAFMRLHLRRLVEWKGNEKYGCVQFRKVATWYTKALRLPKKVQQTARDAVEPARVRGADRAVRRTAPRPRAGASTTRSRRTSRFPPGRFHTGRAESRTQAADRVSPTNPLTALASGFAQVTSHGPNPLSRRITMTPLQSLVADRHQALARLGRPRPSQATNRVSGATGATSNPIIISDLIKTGRFDADMKAFFDAGPRRRGRRLGHDRPAREGGAGRVHRVWNDTKGNDGWVSFELDPLLEDGADEEHRRADQREYIELGKKWSAGHKNRMIKVPATPGGLGALEELAAAGVTLNVTLIFSERQYNARPRRGLARRAAAQRQGEREDRLQHLRQPGGRVHREARPDLSPAAQGQVGIVNAKRIWKLNQEFWADKGLPASRR